VRATHCTTDDGIVLEAEWAEPERASALVVLCHPHPAYGGTMRSIVISALFDALPNLGVACLRFNFRGVEGSGGEYDEGRAEQRDVVAAIDNATATYPPLPLTLVGWSFGADMALTVTDPRVHAWIGIAPPLRFRPARDYDAVGTDPRPKLLVLAAHDEFRAPADIAAEVSEWTNTRMEEVAGASHFFVGRTQRVVELVARDLGVGADELDR
jgi:alpha/beta superfamily hydrolase